MHSGPKIRAAGAGTQKAARTTRKSAYHRPPTRSRRRNPAPAEFLCDFCLGRRALAAIPLGNNLNFRLCLGCLRRISSGEADIARDMAEAPGGLLAEGTIA